MSLTNKEIDELRPLLDTTVKRFLGFSEPTLSTAALKCIDGGYDRNKTIDKLCEILDIDQATVFADRLFSIYDVYKVNQQNKKQRKKKKDSDGDESAPKKRKFTDGNEIQDEPPSQHQGQLSADKIKVMMEQAQKMIVERRNQLGVPDPEVQMSKIQQKTQAMTDAFVKAQRAIQLQTSIQARMSSLGMTTSEAPNLKPSAGIQPTPLILDEEGRTIDAKTGVAVTLQHHTPTLKANIRAKKREEFRGITEKVSEEIVSTKFQDNRLGNKSSLRLRRTFKFNERGKYIQVANRLRTKAQLDKLQASISLAAKRTGIATAAKLATVTASKELQEGEIPQVEWWDSYILQRDSYDGVGSLNNNSLTGITALIEHPIQMACPSESKAVVSIPVFLTKGERRKLRRQSRQENQKEMTEKIRLGLIQPPEPKVRLANLMRVLGTQAVQDPTKVEAHVRAQMAKRQKAHEMANAARKLTPDQRREKKITKMTEDTSLGVHTAIYRVASLRNPSIKFKIEANAKQLMMTGIVVLFKDCNVVVVEGGPRQQRKFERLMLHRIKWAQDKGGKDSDESSIINNSCSLVWQGTTKSRAFSDVKFKQCPTESFARDQFKQQGVDHYWDLAFSSATLDNLADT